MAPWPDRMLQARLFSYPNTHRHRLGPNYPLLPINAPKCRELDVEEVAQPAEMSQEDRVSATSA